MFLLQSLTFPSWRDTLLLMPELQLTLFACFASARTTFIERLMELRLERARKLLGDPQLYDLPVAEVAARCGFADPSHFARRFRRQFGQSPLQFRGSVLGARH